MAYLGTIVPFPDRARSPHKCIWFVAAVVAKAIRQARGGWPAAGIGVGALGVVGNHLAVPAVAVDQERILLLGADKGYERCPE